MYPRSCITFSTLPMFFEAGLIIQALFPITSAFLIVERAFARGSSNTILITLRILLKTHLVGNLPETVPAEVNVVFADKALLSPAPLAYVYSSSGLIYSLCHL